MENRAIKTVNWLVKNNQPFIIIRYPIWLRFTTETVKVYELMYWDNAIHDYRGYEFLIDREDFVELKRKHGLKKLFTEHYGTVFGLDNRFRDVYNEYQKRVSQLNLKLERAQMKLTVAVSNGGATKRLERQYDNIRKARDGEVEIIKNTYKIKER